MTLKINNPVFIHDILSLAFNRYYNGFAVGKDEHVFKKFLIDYLAHMHSWDYKGTNQELNSKLIKELDENTEFLKTLRAGYYNGDGWKDYDDERFKQELKKLGRYSGLLNGKIKIELNKALDNDIIAELYDKLNQYRIKIHHNWEDSEEKCALTPHEVEMFFNEHTNKIAAQHQTVAGILELLKWFCSSIIKVFGSLLNINNEAEKSDSKSSEDELNIETTNTWVNHTKTVQHLNDLDNICVRTYNVT